MKIEALNCPKCNAPLDVPENRDFFRCEYCGSKLIVNRKEGESTNLVRFEATLSQVLDQTNFVAAKMRLDLLPEDLARADADVEQATTELTAAEEASQTLQRQLHNAFRERQTRMAVLSLAAVGTMLLSLWSLGGENTLLWFALTLMLAAGAFYYYMQAQSIQKHAPAQIEEMQVRIRAASEHLQKAKSELEDLQLESEFCRHRARSFRMRSNAI